MDAALLELIELAKSAAPELWEIARAQVLANIWSNKILIWVGVGVIVIMIALMIFVSDGDTEFLASAIGFTLVIFAAVMLLVVKNGKMSMNPDYYAIKVLMGLIGH